jgi:uncharacterized membrane protein
MEFLAQFGPLDAAALALLVLGAQLVGLRIEATGPRWTRSVTVIVADYRRKWMREMVTREPRIFDAAILSSLRQGTSFFASTCVIAIGGTLALIGNAERLTGLVAGLPVDEVVDAAPAILQAKLLLCVLFLTNAFLKFVWANRLFGYCAVVMAAVPNQVDDPATYPTAARAAEINIRAAWNFNRGLRSMYFALAALAWLLGAAALILATCATLWLLWSREFASISRRVLVQTQE